MFASAWPIAPPATTNTAEETLSVSRMRQKRKLRGLASEAELSDGAHNEGSGANASGSEESPEGPRGEEPEIPDSPAGLSDENLAAIIEGLLFVANGPLAASRIAELVPEVSRERIAAALSAIEERFAGRGLILGQVSGGYQFRTHPRVAPWVQKLVAGKPVRLSRAQLETLSIIAYRQPITRPEIDDIRGVDSGGTLRVLLERSVIRVLGKREEPGRPLLYGTTRQFLELFNLESLTELPTLREFHELSDDSLREIEKLDAETGGAEPAAEEPATGEAEPMGEEPPEAEAR